MSHDSLGRTRRKRALSITLASLWLAALALGCGFLGEDEEEVPRDVTVHAGTFDALSTALRAYALAHTRDIHRSTGPSITPQMLLRAGSPVAISVSTTFQTSTANGVIASIRQELGGPIQLDRLVVRDNLPVAGTTYAVPSQAQALMTALHGQLGDAAACGRLPLRPRSELVSSCAEAAPIMTDDARPDSVHVYLTWEHGPVRSLSGSASGGDPLTWTGMRAMTR